MRPIEFTAASRLLVIAPHPDDESLACGGLIQHAVAAGAQVRVLSVTDGDNNPWPQRVLERRVRIGPEQRVSWGRRRRSEVLAATAILGLRDSDVVFAGLPDQGLTTDLLSGQSALRPILQREIESFAPTIIVSPSLHDTHPDHSAAAVLVRLALRESATPPGLHEYLIHGRASFDGEVPWGVALSRGQVDMKRDAICCHRSQTLVSRKRFLSYATGEELFHAASAADVAHPISRVTRANGELRIELRARRWFDRASAAQLHLLWCDGPRIVAQHRVQLANGVRGGGVVLEMTDDSGNVLGRGKIDAAGNLLLPINVALHATTLYLHRRGGIAFFDEAGWREIAL
ncbi:hypothetical protein BH10PLA1_BH10PLA1_12690 [soil metagenome]